MQIKQEAESQPNHQNLTTTKNLKIGNKSQFILTQRSRNKSPAVKGNIDSEDLVCPFSDGTDT